MPRPARPTEADRSTRLQPSACGDGVSRVDALFCAFVPLWLTIAADLAFPTVLAVVVACELIDGGQRARLPMVIPIIVLLLAQLLMDLGSEAGIGGLGAYGWRLGLAAIVILISVIGGRDRAGVHAQLAAEARSTTRAACGRNRRSSGARRAACGAARLGPVPGGARHGCRRCRSASLALVTLARCCHAGRAAAVRIARRLFLAGRWRGGPCLGDMGSRLSVELRYMR